VGGFFMKRIVLIIFVIILIGLGIWYFMKWNTERNAMTEYTPPEEINYQQALQTQVTLYFKNKGDSTLGQETRSIDAKDLIINPYETLINLLIAGPKSDTLDKTIPDGTKLNKAELNNGILIVDLSKEFANNCPMTLEDQSVVVYSLVNTLTELTEVNAVKILIDGQENQAFNYNGMSFKESFVRKI